METAQQLLQGKMKARGLTGFCGELKSMKMCVKDKGVCETCVKVFERVVTRLVGLAVCSGCGCVWWVWLCIVGAAKL